MLRMHVLLLPRGREEIDTCFYDVYSSSGCSSFYWWAEVVAVINGTFFCFYLIFVFVQEFNEIRHFSACHRGLCFEFPYVFMCQGGIAFKKRHTLLFCSVWVWRKEERKNRKRKAQLCRGRNTGTTFVCTTTLYCFFSWIEPNKEKGRYGGVMTLINSL